MVAEESLLGKFRVLWDGKSSSVEAPAQVYNNSFEKQDPINQTELYNKLSFENQPKCSCCDTSFSSRK